MARTYMLCAVTCAVLLGSGCAKREWKEFSSADGKFKVSMLGQPKEETQNVDGVALKIFTVEEKNGVYGVAYADLPLAPGEFDAQTQTRLDGTRDGILGNIGGKLQRETRITLNGKYPGREVLADIPSKGGVLRARLYIVGRRLYQVLATGTKAWADAPEATKFLESFELTK